MWTGNSSPLWRDLWRITKTSRLWTRCYWNHGFWGLLPHRMGLCTLCPWARHLSRSWSWLGGRFCSSLSIRHYRSWSVKIRFALWTVLESRAGKHARYRYWLLLWKARSSYRICNAKIRSSSCVPDYYFRYRGGSCGYPWRRSRTRLATGWGKPHCEDDSQRTGDYLR